MVSDGCGTELLETKVINKMNEEERQESEALSKDMDVYGMSSKEELSKGDAVTACGVLDEVMSDENAGTQNPSAIASCNRGNSMSAPMLYTASTSDEPPKDMATLSANSNTIQTSHEKAKQLTFLKIKKKSEVDRDSQTKVDALFTPENELLESPGMLSETETSVSTTDNLQEDFSSPPQLLSLPIDSLHYIASFLTPSEWCNGFGVASKASNSLSRQIIRRVRMHGFKCATEVVTAFKLGQFADAKELAALYISNGVPIYARCLGHSYHTVHWRIQVEAREQQILRSQMSMEKADRENAPPPPPSPPIDPFYSSRLDFRNREGYSRELTYVEEKSLFLMEKRNASNSSETSTARRTPGSGPLSNGRSSFARASPLTDVRDGKKDGSKSPKVPMQIHQHLLDQHLNRQYFVNDYEGKLGTPEVSLSADFFHPGLRSGSNKGSQRIPTPLDHSGQGIDNHANRMLQRTNAFSSSVEEEGNEGTTQIGPNATPFDTTLAPDMAVIGTMGERRQLDEGIRRLPVHDEHEDELFQPPQPLPVIPVAQLKSALASVEFEVYSSTVSQNLTAHETVPPDGTLQIELRRHLRSRFATYQRRLEGFLSQGTYRSSGHFQECLLDFWDEFFPHSAGIHYHDTETAVPRISCMQKFLTKPCPRSVGVVQCEIERIKISSRGKGVNMKGRLFPTYEYRLFIRNRPVSQSSDSLAEGAGVAETPENFVRRDTVLMVAKNRGRKHAEAAGVIPMSSTPKKGSNNYYLYMPQQMDVDAHYNKVNSNGSSHHQKQPARFQPNGANHHPVLTSEDAGTVLLGRLQSNFIGTEFQIFTPKLKKLPSRQQRTQLDARGGSQHTPSSDDELGYDSGFSSDTNNVTSSARKSRFGRLSLLRNHHHNPDQSTSSDAGAMSDSSSPFSTDQARPMTRTFSSPEISQHIRQTRTNRRAIANSSDAKHLRSRSSQLMCEEESGVITYTANLLGSRPRIMDVCLPRVSQDGSIGMVWKKYLESCNDGTQENHDQCRMLSCFRQLQQRRENMEHHNIAVGPPGEMEAVPREPIELPRHGESDSDPSDDFGLMVLQNRPPWWNVELGSFVLNFGGRVSVASVKNFQLCERTDQDRIMLQFGRIQGRHSFTMDFQHPLTAVQAFSIAISSLQSKISFG